MKNKIFYYNVSPRYVRKSGRLSFSYFCSHLNKKTPSVPVDVAPFLTQRARDCKFSNKFTRIVINLDTPKILQFDKQFRVRYFLNYDNLLLENISSNDDYILSYRQGISGHLQTPKFKSRIFLPVVSPVFFHTLKKIKRLYRIFYADIYKYHFVGETFPVKDGLSDVTSDMSDSKFQGSSI